MAVLDSVDLTNGIPVTGTGTVPTLSATNKLVGEVQASPTANTLLDRLKTINTSLAPLASALVVSQPASLISVTCVLDTSPYASGDLLVDTQVITAALRTSGGYATLHSVHLIDEDDQGVAMDIYILDALNTLGTFNIAPAVTDANARAILGAPIAIAAADWKDLGGCRIAGRDGIGKIVKGNGSADLYFAIVNGTGTPTFTASGLRLRFGFLQS